MNRESFCTITLTAAALGLASLAASAAEAPKSNEPQDVIIVRRQRL